MARGAAGGVAGPHGHGGCPVSPSRPLQVGDRFIYEEGDWEVTGRPYTTRAGKVVHVTIQVHSWLRRLSGQRALAVVRRWMPREPIRRRPMARRAQCWSSRAPC